jgi:hypothetical protein
MVIIAGIETEWERCNWCRVREVISKIFFERFSRQST